MEHEEFLALWRREMGKSDRDRQPACPIAVEFQAKLDDTIFRPLAGKQLNRRLIAQAKYMLQEEYHAWRKAVPALHLKALHRHERCLDEVYEVGYDRLHLLELTMRPVMNIIVDYDDLTKPAPLPPQSVKPRVAYGSLLGEVFDDDDTEI